MDGRLTGRTGRTAPHAPPGGCRFVRRTIALPVVAACALALAVAGGAGTPGSLAAPLPAAIRLPIPTPHANPTPPPGSGIGGTFPAPVPGVVETDDPAGDVAWHPAGAALRRPAAAPAIDITHLEAWSAGGSLHVEVTLAGRAPAAGGPATLVRLLVGRGGTWLAAPVCSVAALCTLQDGGPPFGWSVRQRAAGWVVAYALPWSGIAGHLGEPFPLAAGYEVLATASAVSLDAVWIDLAPEGDPLHVVPDATPTLQEVQAAVVSRSGGPAGST